MTTSSLLLVDSHVHIYSCFNLVQLLDSAYSNFQQHAKREYQANSFTGMLLLTESTGDNWFQELESWAFQGKAIQDELDREWFVHRTHEKCSLVVRSNQGAELWFLAGRQVVTKENLEVLALLTETQVPDGMGLKDSVDSIRDNGGIPVIPWGVGKWWGARGETLAKFLFSQMPLSIFLGDNSGRPWFLPYPPQFQQAQKQGIAILPGSDPLPLSSEYWRPGSTGFAVQGRVSRDTPANDLRQLLGDPRTKYFPYHRTENMIRFVRNQIAMHVTKHRRSMSI